MVLHQVHSTLEFCKTGHYPVAKAPAENAKPAVTFRFSFSQNKTILWDLDSRRPADNFKETEFGYEKKPQIKLLRISSHESKND